jgi:hypothetical protein
MRPSDKWENLAEVLRVLEPDLEMKLAYCRSHPPNLQTQPVSSAVVAAYISLLELELTTIRRAARGLQDQFRERPTLTDEITQIESWILRRKSGEARRQLTDRDEQALGDWFVSKMGFSYSDTKRYLRQARQLLSGKGAPNKKPETLRMLDARICNDWSYPEIARRMCDCGSLMHTEHCAERIRKRIKGLEAFLTERNINYSR